MTTEKSARQPDRAEADLQARLRKVEQSILDLEAEMRAADESMTAPTPGRVAERLQLAHIERDALQDALGVRPPPG